MKRPLNSSMEAYKIMKDCWNNDPLHRPTFSDLVKDFEHLLTIAKECNYLQMSETFERPLADKGGKYKYTYLCDLLYNQISKLDILFLSNHNIHKSLFSLCFWASDPLINRSY